MRGSLMRLRTREQHAIILTKYPDDKEAAAHYTSILGREVTRQNVRYWRHVFINHEGKLASADRDLMQARRLRVPSPDDDLGVLPNLDKVYKCILVIPDQHYPYNHPDLLPFLREVKANFPLDLVVNLGDEADYHALSFHDSDPNLDSAGTELEKAKAGLEALHREFPKMLICNSNHGSMVYRKAKHHGIPVQAIKRYRDILFPRHGAPHWSWGEEWFIRTPLGDVLFKHQSSNLLADAAHNRANVMVGHSHVKFTVEYCASRDFLYWGANAGCLIDNDAYAFAYGKHSHAKPIIGCAVILEGRPVLIPMILNTDGRWVGRL